MSRAAHAGATKISAIIAGGYRRHKLVTEWQLPNTNIHAAGGMTISHRSACPYSDAVADGLDLTQAGIRVRRLSVPASQN
jgi:hypothetical protein